MQSFSYLIYLITILFTFSIVHSKKAVDEQHCEVCIKTITTFADTLSDGDKTKPEKNRTSI